MKVLDLFFFSSQETMCLCQVNSVRVTLLLDFRQLPQSLSMVVWESLVAFFFICSFFQQEVNFILEAIGGFLRSPKLIIEIGQFLCTSGYS